jgi:acetyl-CoA carboxylase biotin carboxyl carrier protein
MTEYRKARDPYAELGIAPPTPAPRPVAAGPAPSFAPAPASPAPLRTREEWRPAAPPSVASAPPAIPTERLMRPAPSGPAPVPPLEPEVEGEPARPARLQIRTTTRIEALILAEIARRCAEGTRGRGKANRTVVIEEAIERTYGHLIPGQEK